MEDNNEKDDNQLEINFGEPMALDMESILAEIDSVDLRPKNPYTHEINFDAVESLSDLIDVMKNLDISVDPKQWKGDTKYIKLKGE